MPRRPLVWLAAVPVHQPSAWLGVLLACLAGGLAATEPGPARLRRVLRPLAESTPHRPSGRAGAVLRRPALAVLCGAGVASVLGGRLGLLAGAAAAAVLLRTLPGRDSVRLAAQQRAVTAGAPLACDLLAATLTAGAPVPVALRAVARADGGPLGGLLNDVAASLELGAAPQEAWAAVGRSPPLQPLARAAVRAAGSGAALADALGGVADDLRQASYADGQAAARRAGVRLVGPLTACFLPAFVVLGVVPFVAGLLPTALG